MGRSARLALACWHTVFCRLRCLLAQPAAARRWPRSRATSPLAAERVFRRRPLGPAAGAGHGPARPGRRRRLPTADTGAPPEPRWVASVVGLGAAGGLNVAPACAGGYVFPSPVTYDAAAARPRTLQHLLRRLPRPRRHGPRQDRGARLFAPAVVPHRPAARGAVDPLLRRDQPRLRRHADVLGQDRARPTAGPIIAYIRALQLSQDVAVRGPDARTSGRNCRRRRTEMSTAGDRPGRPTWVRCSATR